MTLSSSIDIPKKYDEHSPYPLPILVIIVILLPHSLQIICHAFTAFSSVFIVVKRVQVKTIMHFFSSSRK
jgi:hypothetical protein